MTGVTLFDAARSVRDALNVADPETGELSDQYSTSRELFERKGPGCVAYAVEEAAMIEASEKMLASMHKKVATRKARLCRFHDYVADCMKLAGFTKLSADGLAVATLYIDRDESVEIDDGVEFPPEFCLDPRPPGLSKAKIKAAILAGEPVAGARIVRRDRLTIK